MLPNKRVLTSGTFGMGVAVGDFDNDGWHDLYITEYGELHALPE